MQMLIGCCHDAAQQIARTSHFVHLKNFGDVREAVDHARFAALRDLERGEREHAVTLRAQIEYRFEPAHDASVLETIEPRLGGVAGHAKLSRKLEHVRAGDFGQFRQGRALILLQYAHHISYFWYKVRSRWAGAWPSGGARRWRKLCGRRRRPARPPATLSAGTASSSGSATHARPRASSCRRSAFAAPRTPAPKRASPRRRATCS